jgi:hypothetical protein
MNRLYVDQINGIERFAILAGQDHSARKKE